MSRKWILLAALSLTSCTCLCAQEQEPSLGDVARQARKAKEAKNAAGTTKAAVITDDTLSLSKSATSLGFGNPSNAGSSPNDAIAHAHASLEQAERALALLGPMDRTQLAKLALEGRDVDFPGRRAWEEKLFFTKQSYVAHGRRLVDETKEVLANIEALSSSGKIPPSDPRAQELLHRAHELMRDAFQTEADFQAVIVEGQNMARTATPR